MTTRNEPTTKKFTYGDYLTWSEDERWELLEGEPFAMTPSPGPDHQRVSRELCFQIRSFLEGKPCEMFAAPIDVLLPEGDEPDEEVITVLEPDVLVLCDPAKVTRRGIRGAPDFIVEVLSPSTASRDQIRKRRLYEKHGVKEFWTVDPVHRFVFVYRRGEGAGGAPSSGGRGRAGKPTVAPGFGPAEMLPFDGLRLEVRALPGLVIDFDRVLPLPRRVVRDSPAPYHPQGRARKRRDTLA